MTSPVRSALLLTVPGSRIRLFFTWSAAASFSSWNVVTAEKNGEMEGIMSITKQYTLQCTILWISQCCSMNTNNIIAYCNILHTNSISSVGYSLGTGRKLVWEITICLNCPCTVYITSHEQCSTWCDIVIQERGNVSIGMLILAVLVHTDNILTGLPHCILSYTVDLTALPYLA